MRAAYLLPAVLLTVTLGCGSAPVDSTAVDARTYESARWGYSVRIPQGWHRAERRLTALTEPVEVLVAATYVPQPGDENCGPLAFDGFESDDVLTVVLERGLDPASEWSDFPPRPERFEYEPGRTSGFVDCLGATPGAPMRNHWFNFTDAGRHFHVLVVIGEDTAPGAGTDAYRLLDSLRFDPRVKPDWPASE